MSDQISPIYQSQATGCAIDLELIRMITRVRIDKRFDTFEGYFEVELPDAVVKVGLPALAAAHFERNKLIRSHDCAITHHRVVAEHRELETVYGQALEAERQKLIQAWAAFKEARERQQATTRAYAPPIG